MLIKLRTRLIKVFTRSSLVVALAFGANAVAFILLQNKLENSVGRNEAQIAFQSTLAGESDYVNTMLINYEACKNNDLNKCEAFAKNLVIRVSRISDIKIFFQEYPFELENNSPIIKNLDSVMLSIHTITQEGFQLSLDNAYKAGINNATAYAKYVTKADDAIARKINQAELDDEVQLIRDNIIFMRAWSEEEIYKSNEVKNNIKNIWLCLTVLIAFEIALYFLVSASDFWLTNIPTKNNAEGGRRFIRNRSALPMLGVVIFGFCGVVVSQGIVYVELQRTVLEGCRRINRNSLFALNSKPEKDSIYRNSFFPEYCKEILVSNPKIPLGSRPVKEANSESSNREMILNYADKLSDLQRKRSNQSSQLALSLLVFNAFALAFDAVKLDYQNMDFEEP